MHALQTRRTRLCTKSAETHLNPAIVGTQSPRPSKTGTHDGQAIRNSRRSLGQRQALKVHTINTILKLSKTLAALIALATVFFAAAGLRYQEPVNIERVCEDSPPPLINNFNSCSLVDQTLDFLEAEDYKPVLLESSEKNSGLLRKKFSLKIFEVPNYKMNNSTGPAQFSFINGRLFATSYFPKASDTVFERRPTSKSETLTVKQLTNHQGLKYISWSNNHLEAYITWWISRFS